MVRRSWRYCYNQVLTFTAMVSLECIIVGLNTLFKAATLKGMSYHVFMVYDYAIAALVLLPAPFFSYSLVADQEFFLHSASILSKIGLLGLIGISSQIMGYTGIIYSSPTLASAISNLTPAFTFILAILFRKEKLVWKRSSSQAKVMGTIISIIGAFVVTLYKGQAIVITSTPSMSGGANLNWVIGGVFLTVQYILFPLWLIVLTQIVKEYPAELTVVFFYNLCVSCIAAIVGLAMERNSSAWRIRPDIALASVVCSGLFSSCLSNIVHSWALRLTGPVFVAMFKPFSIAIAVVMGIMFLGDTLHLGSLIGAITISIGFYTVMWGKAKEAIAEDCGSGTAIDSSSSHKAPLLQSYKNESSVETNA